MRKNLPLLAMAGIYILVQVCAVLLAPLFLPEFTAFPDPNSPTNPFIYIFMVLVMTAIILILIKYGRQRIVQAIFYVSIFITLLYVFLPIFLLFDSEGILALIASLAIASLLLVLLAKSGEWYIIDAVALIIGVGVTAILGMSLGILPVVILLVIMAIYDAISVYKTKHMVALAEGVAPLRLPVLFVVPKERGFTMDKIEKGGIVKKEGGEREAFFMGVGDAVIPGILVVSASLYLPAAAAPLLTANLWAATGAMIGGLLGYLVLFRIVMRGNPQAGLPFLNTGAILGYLAAYALAYGTVGLSMLGL
ncbi:MAG: presenilin family intramembrane aspartyl protease PSH [Methanomassiliicoccus sp.]|nr:presenilin family intramembrane aspartyl protease PSH [Methanomassiliicoccus sp.]